MRNTVKSLGVPQLEQLQVEVVGLAVALKNVEPIFGLRRRVSEFYVVSFLEQIPQRRDVLSILDCLPVYLFEEGVLLEILEGYSLVGILFEQTQQHVSELETHAPDLAVDLLIDEFFLHHLLVVVQTELSLAFIFDQYLLEFQLEHQDSHRPQVGALIESAVHDFWRHVLYRSKKRSDAFLQISLQQYFGEAVVCELDVPVIIDQYVFGFELPVNDAGLMQKLNSDDDLGEHVSDGTFGEDEVLLSGVEIEVALGQVLHHDVNVFLILEDLGDVGEEGVLADCRNQLRLQQVELVDLRLGDDLHRETHIRRFLLC